MSLYGTLPLWHPNKATIHIFFFGNKVYEYKHKQTILCKRSCSMGNITGSVGGTLDWFVDDDDFGAVRSDCGVDMA